MKKHNAKKNGFYKDPKKQYLKKYRFYPMFLYSCLDKWLKDMSLKGWHIVHCGLLTFVFEKGEPCEKEYFTYGLSTQEGKYSISLRYPFLEETYGLKSKKSKINFNKAKAYKIVEIDLDKINIKDDIGYNELKNDRNHLYLEYFIRNTVIFSFVLVLLVFLWFLK